MIDPELLERVRARIAEDGAAISPAAVGMALRAEGGLVGDAAVLEMVDALQLDAVGRRARSSRCFAGPESPTSWSTARARSMSMTEAGCG